MKAPWQVLTRKICEIFHVSFFVEHLRPSEASDIEIIVLGLKGTKSNISINLPYFYQTFQQKIKAPSREQTKLAVQIKQHPLCTRFYITSFQEFYPSKNMLAGDCLKKLRLNNMHYALGSTLLAFRNFIPVRTC